MITQVIWTDVNNRELDNIYARVGDDEIREIQFIICRNDPPEKVEIPAGVSGQFRMIKSSGNFVVRNMTKTVKEDGTVIFTVSVSDQMVNVQGTGYYDIRLSGGGYLYTASGRFIVDTPVISTSVLEDVSEVNGVVFPDDFYTKDDQVAVIDDDTISNDSTWSSEKISDQIDIIDDNTISNGSTWSSEKINDEIDNSGKHEYSTNEKVVGMWIDGKTVYEKTIDFGYLPNNTTKDVAHNISNIDKIWISEGFVYAPGGWCTFVNLPNDNFAGQWQCFVNNTYIEFWTGMDRTDRYAYVVVRYTKTTQTRESR